MEAKMCSILILLAAVAIFKTGCEYGSKIEFYKLKLSIECDTSSIYKIIEKIFLFCVF